MLKNTPSENVVNQSVKAVTNDLNDTIKVMLSSLLMNLSHPNHSVMTSNSTRGVIISGIPENDKTSSETLVCSFLNQYVECVLEALLQN